MKTKTGATLVGSLISITILATTFVSLLNLQASIIRAKFFVENDNTANLLATEGLEIVRAIYTKNNGSLTSGRYALDYNSDTLKDNSGCEPSSINNTCALSLLDNYYKLGGTDKIFYRFVEIDNPDNGNLTKVTSTVVVKNPRGADRVYKAVTELYKIN